MKLCTSVYRCSAHKTASSFR